MNVVVIDDEPGILYVLSKLFTKMDWNTRTFDDEFNAIEYLSTTTEMIDIILLDLDLKHTNGIEILKKIKELRPHQAVIMISGRYDPQFVDLLYKQGINGFVQKPFVFAELRESISKVLSTNT
jgi:DNA-binding NtrC family response regulator